MKIEVIVGSMLGAAEYVADELEQLLQDEHEVSQHLQPNLSELAVDGSSIWLICTSTHGAGDYPDNIKPFAEQLAAQHPKLHQLHYGVIGLGSSQYDTFCHAAKNFDHQITALGGQKIGQRLEIDVSEYPVPEEALPEWLTQWRQMLPES